MKIFKSMTKEQAKQLYYKLLKENQKNSIVKIAINDLIFFTKNFTKNY